MARPLVRREVVEHALARRALLLALERGRADRTEVCDADPLLRQAAAHDGRPAGTPCPVCRDPRLRVVAWVFGDALRAPGGRSATPREVDDLARAHGELAVHEVEVCARCGWHHLQRSAKVGRPRRPAASRGPGRSARGAVPGSRA